MSTFFRQRSFSTCKALALLAGVSVSQLPSIQAVDVYWDTNGASVGATSSGTANGTWDSSSTGNWTTNPTGLSATSTYAIANGSDPANANVFFSAGTNATLSANITLSGAVIARSITVKDLMNITSAGSTPSLTLGAGGLTIADTAVGTTTWLSTLPTTLSASQSWNNNSNFLFTNAGTVTGAASSATTLTFSGSGSGGSTLTGLIANGASGTTALAVNTTGGGVTTISNGNNSFSGEVTLTQGILRASQSGATGTTLGSGGLNLGGGELQLARSSNSNATALGNATVVTGNTQVTSIRNSSNAGVTHSLGTLSIGTQTLTIASDPLATSGTAGINFGATTLTGSATFDVVNGPSSATRLNLGALNGSGSLTKEGSGNLYLASAAGSFTGDTFIKSSSIVVSNSSALGTGTIHLGAATGNNDATLSTTLGNATLSNNIVVTANSGSAIFRILNPSAASNTAVTFAGTVGLNDDLTVIATAGGGNITFANAISGPASGMATINHDGTGSVTYANTSTLGSNINLVQNGGTVILSGTNTAFTGSVTINGGQLNTTAAGLAGGVNVVSIGSSGTLFNSQGNSTPVVIAGLTDGLGGGGLVNMNASNRFLSLAGSGTYSFSGSIIQGGLNKTGTGTQVLTGSNSYLAATTISVGTLLVEGSLGNTAVTVNGGTLGGSGVIDGPVTINSTASLSPGSSPGTLTINNSLSMLNGSNYLFEGGDLVEVNGLLDLDNNWTLTLGVGFVNGGSVTIFTYNSLAGSPDLTPTFDITNLGFAPSGPLSLTDTGSSIVLNGISVIPEPSTVLLTGIGLAFALSRVRHKRRS